MRRVGRGLAVLMIGAVFFTVTAGIAGAKTVSDEKYAKKLCGTLNGAVDDVSGIEPSQSDDPATSQTETLAAVDESDRFSRGSSGQGQEAFARRWRQEDHKALRPYIKELTSKIQDGRDEFAAADPSSPAFTADLTVLGVDPPELGAWA